MNNQIINKDVENLQYSIKIIVSIIWIFLKLLLCSIVYFILYFTIGNHIDKWYYIINTIYGIFVGRILSISLPDNYTKYNNTKDKLINNNYYKRFIKRKVQTGGKNKWKR